MIELFSIALTVETLQAEICWRERFLKGVGHFDCPLKVEGDVAHAALWYSSDNTKLYICQLVKFQLCVSIILIKIDYEVSNF